MLDNSFVAIRELFSQSVSTEEDLQKKRIAITIAKLFDGIGKRTIFPVSDPQYGIDITGTRDSSTQFNNLLNLAAGRGTVLIDRSFKCDHTIITPSNTTIAQLDRTFSINFSWTLASGQGGSVYIVNSDQINGNTNIRFLGVNFKGAGDGTPQQPPLATPVSGLLMRRVTDVDILGCRFYRVPGISCALQGVTRGNAVLNKIVESGRDGITCWWYGVGWNLADILIALNTMDVVGDDGIAIHSSSTDVGGQNTDVLPTRIRILGNSVRHAWGRGCIVDAAEDVIISDLYVRDTFAAGLFISKDSIVGSSNFRSHDIQVNNVRIRNAGSLGDGSQPQNGAYIFGVDEIDVDNVRIDGSITSGFYSFDITEFNYTNIRSKNNGAIGIDLDGSTTTINGGKLARCRSKGNQTNGFRLHTNLHVDCEDNVALNNGANVAGGSTNSGFLVVAGTQINFNRNKGYDTRAGGSRTQAHGFSFQSVGSTVMYIMHNKAYSNVGGGWDFISGTLPAVGSIQRGNYDSVTPLSDIDQNGILSGSGTGSPETVVIAKIGSTWRRTDGGAGTSLYVKETGTGNTGWVGK